MYSDKKELLKIAINTLKKHHEKQQRWQDTFNEMFDGHFVPTYSDDLEGVIIKALETIYSDEYEIISWWIYEQDFGEKCKEKPAMWDNNGPINLRNIDELHEYLIQNMENLEDNEKNEEESITTNFDKQNKDIKENSSDNYQKIDENYRFLFETIFGKIH